MKGSPKVLPLDAWPEADRDCWLAAFVPPPASLPRALRYQRPAAVASPPGVTPDHRPPRPRRRQSTRHPSSWSAAYRARVARGYGLWLGWAARAGAASDEVTPETVARFVDSLADDGNGTVSLASYCYELWRCLTLIRPEIDWTWLNRDWRALEGIAVKRRDKRAGLVPLEALLELGFELMDSARREIPAPEVAVRCRDGLLIALVAYRPKRARNLAELRFGSTVLEHGCTVEFVWPSSKNGDRIECAMPARLLPYWRLWLDVFRPLLPRAAESDAVWLSLRGTAMAADELSTAVARRTEVGLGIALRLHMVRTLYGTSVIAEEPALRPAVARQLDHRDSRSLEAYETHARSLGAGKILDRSLAPLLAGRPGAGSQARRRGATGRGPAASAQWCVAPSVPCQ